MLLLSFFAFALGLDSSVWATPVRRAIPIIYNGRAPSNITGADLDQSKGPYLAAVKGSKNASQYFQFLGKNTPPTPLWPVRATVQEQVIRATIDNSSVFTPGSNPPQFGFRRGELIAQDRDQPGNRTAFNAQIESGLTAFHFSVQADSQQQLNFGHEYQPLFIEPNDGTHVFDLQTGTPFNTTVSDADARMLRIRSHSGNVLFQTPFVENTWHNFAVAVDWDKLTLQAFYSQNADDLKAVSQVEDNSGVAKGPDGQGDFHFGLLKLPLINPADSLADQADVSHKGIQEGTTESILYSGVFVESAQNGVTIGNGITENNPR
ncbi:hypothetical protein EDB85DRAFT_2004399 [Lactarius pseudohatsudake]|nr:hypothetical protein EDB85DRAFT_2004399 [Lactarius pseudohatsudake]